MIQLYGQVFSRSSKLSAHLGLPTGGQDGLHRDAFFFFNHSTPTLKLLTRCMQVKD